MEKEKKLNPEIVEIICQKCRENIIHPKETIDGLPTIHFKAIEFGTEETTEKKDIFLSAKFNNFKKTGHKFKKGAILRLFCPHCGEEFERYTVKCSTCKEKLIVLSAKNGTFHIMGICPTVGCHNHKSNIELPSECPIITN